MPIITDEHVNIYKTTITQVREALGRVATIYLPPTVVDCPWCIYDPVNKKSSGVAASGYVWSTHPDYVSPLNDKLCPNCAGEGEIETEVTYTTLATKKDLSYNDRNDNTAGQFKPGTIRLSCDLSNVLVDTADLEGDTYFDRAIKVTYDGVTFNVVNVTKGGLRDLYTCRVILERTNK